MPLDTHAIALNFDDWNVPPAVEQGSLEDADHERLSLEIGRLGELEEGRRENLFKWGKVRMQHMLSWCIEHRYPTLEEGHREALIGKIMSTGHLADICTASGLSARITRNGEILETAIRAWMPAPPKTRARVLIRHQGALALAAIMTDLREDQVRALRLPTAMVQEGMFSVDAWVEAAFESYPAALRVAPRDPETFLQWVYDEGFLPEYVPDSDDMVEEDDEEEEEEGEEGEDEFEEWRIDGIDPDEIVGEPAPIYERAPDFDEAMARDLEEIAEVEDLV